MGKKTGKGIGFTSQIFTFYAFPRRNVGRRWERTINGIHYVASSEYDVPYSLADRRVIEIITTKARQTLSPSVDIISVPSMIESYKLGDSRYSEKASVMGIKRFGGLNIFTERTNDIHYKGKVYKKYQAINMKVSSHFQIVYPGELNFDPDPDYPDGTFFVFDDDFYKNFIVKSVPHVQADYLKLTAPIDQDLYIWLTMKMFALKDKTELIQWNYLFAQFSKNHTLRGDDLQHAKNDIKNSLLKIQRDCYTQARFEFTYEGIILRKSPLLIEPGDKGAGYSPATPPPEDSAVDMDAAFAEMKKRFGNQIVNHPKTENPEDAARIALGLSMFDSMKKQRW
jgi:hypothetical protein